MRRRAPTLLSSMSSDKLVSPESVLYLASAAIAAASELAVVVLVIVSLSHVLT